MAARPPMRGYVLAGGRSSRMGEDKAAIVFEGRSMLEIAVASMKEVCEQVSVVGAREHVPPGAGCVRDTYSGCGPLGGIHAALLDCRAKAADFAVFLPVDMPLLPGGLLRAFAAWASASGSVRLALSVADGRLQPLVSMMHVDVLPTMEEALRRGDHALQPTLWAAAESMALDRKVSVDSVFLRTSFVFGDRVVLTGSGEQLAWSPSDAEWRRRSLWFANLNTRADLRDALPDTMGLDRKRLPGETTDLRQDPGEETNA